MSKLTGKNNLDEARRKFLRLLGMTGGGFILSYLGVDSLVGNSFLDENLDMKVRDSDPENPELGEIWYRKDLA